MRDKDDFSEAVRMLLKARVAVNEKNIYGDTALLLAAMNQYQMVVELLPAAGANPFLENDEHLKPIDVVPDRNSDTMRMRSLITSSGNHEAFMSRQQSVPLNRMTFVSHGTSTHALAFAAAMFC